MKALFLVAMALSLSACVVDTVAKTAVGIVTLPVKVASAGVNAVMPSQKKADEKRGRDLRQQDEERGRLAREQSDRCLRQKPLPSDDCSTVQPR